MGPDGGRKYGAFVHRLGVVVETLSWATGLKPPHLLAAITALFLLLFGTTIASVSYLAGTQAGAQPQRREGFDASAGGQSASGGQGSGTPQSTLGAGYSSNFGLGSTGSGSSLYLASPYGKGPAPAAGALYGPGGGGPGAGGAGGGMGGGGPESSSEEAGPPDEGGPIETRTNKARSKRRSAPQVKPEFKPGPIGAFNPAGGVTGQGQLGALGGGGADGRGGVGAGFGRGGGAAIDVHDGPLSGTLSAIPETGPGHEVTGEPTGERPAGGLSGNLPDMPAGKDKSYQTEPRTPEATKSEVNEIGIDPSRSHLVDDGKGPHHAPGEPAEK